MTVGKTGGPGSAGLGGLPEKKKAKETKETAVAQKVLSGAAAAAPESAKRSREEFENKKPKAAGVPEAKRREKSLDDFRGELLTKFKSWVVDFKKCPEPGFFHATYQLAKAAGKLDLDAKRVALEERLKKVTTFGELHKLMVERDAEMQQNVKSATGVCSKEQVECLRRGVKMLEAQIEEVKKYV